MVFSNFFLLDSLQEQILVICHYLMSEYFFTESREWESNGGRDSKN